jgi:hypothetical protein
MSNQSRKTGGKKSGSRSGSGLRVMKNLTDRELKHFFDVCCRERMVREWSRLFELREFPKGASATKRAVIHKLRGSPKPYDVEELRHAGV